MSEKKKRLLELDVHQRKLSNLIGELLKKADEIDQNSKTAHVHLKHEWHDRLASSCRELAQLSETVLEIEMLIKASNVKESEEALLRCTNIAKHLSARLNELKREAHQC